MTNRNLKAFFIIGLTFVGLNFSAKSQAEEIFPENVYPNIPAISNIFKGREVQEYKELKPFGYEFLTNNRTTEFSFSNIGNDYILSAGDKLEISIFGGLNKNFELEVNNQNEINLPELGLNKVKVSYLGALKEKVAFKLKSIDPNSFSDINLVELKKIRVYLSGEIKTPGSYDVSSAENLVNILSKAGGINTNGSLRNISVIRNNKVVKNIDLYDLILKGKKLAFKLQDNDSIYINFKKNTISIQGLVNRPAIYELKGETKLSEVFNLAGGLTKVAYLKDIEVRRVKANEEINIKNINFNQFQTFMIKDKDSITVKPILQKDNQLVYLSGHVFRPGKYSFHNKMKLSELINSQQDLLPEPYMDYARIIRLEGKDSKVTTLSFSLNKLFKDKNDLLLKPNDTIFIYSRWQFDRFPKVEVKGEIFKPGSYNLLSEERVMDLLLKAGGLQKNTYDRKLDLIRKNAYGERQFITIDLKKALSGDLSHNIKLQDEDELMLYSLSDIITSKSVTISGEVTKPGTYTLTENMRLLDLLNLAGNIKKSAKSEGELLRYSNINNQIEFKTLNLNLNKAMTNDINSNLLLQDMDRIVVKTVRDWDKIGSTMNIQGEVKYPGVYSIKPGEKLSDVIERAGGFLETAFPEGIIFYNKRIKNIQQEKLSELDKELENKIYSEEDKQKESIKYNISLSEIGFRDRRIQYLKSIKDKIKLSEATGRLALNISSLKALKSDSTNNIMLENDDTIIIPRKPDHIYLEGQVLAPNAIIYSPGKTLRHYIEIAGGITPEADLSQIKLIKASGFIKIASGNIFSNLLDEIPERGDTIFIPQASFQRDLLISLDAIASETFNTLLSARFYFVRTNR